MAVVQLLPAKLAVVSLALVVRNGHVQDRIEFEVDMPLALRLRDPAQAEPGDRTFTRGSAARGLRPETVLLHGQGR